jgi:hypothetical protein
MPANPDPQTATSAGELAPVIQADRNLWRTLIGLPERNMRRRENGEPVVDALQLLAAHRLAHAKEQAAGENGLPCERCQGNGEIVTDWKRYMHAKPGDVGDEAVADCPDCGGTGRVESLAAPASSVPEPSSINSGNIVWRGEEWVPLEAYREAMAGWKAANASSVPDRAQLVEALEAWKAADQASADAIEHMEQAIAEGWYDEPGLSGHVLDSQRREEAAWARAKDLRDQALAALSAANGEGER